MALQSKRSRALPLVLVAVFAVVAVLGLWLALRVGMAPEITLETEWPAVGRSNLVTAAFRAPGGRLGAIRLELTQGGRSELLAEQRFEGGLGLPLLGGGTAEATLEATVGTEAVPWLAEGELLLRAVAERPAGLLRSPEPVVLERTLAVRRRPPRLELLSSQHYARQGGSGAVVYRVGDSAARSGVRAGDFESVGSPLPGGAGGDRFVLYALPWTIGDSSQIRLFAVDDAGNRAEQPFLDLYKPMPPRTDTINVTDAFLERVVPAITSQTPGFDTSGSLLDQYLRINGDLRRAELAEIAALAAASEPAFLWSGPFLQMPNTALEANFAETRTYVYSGRQVDRQTHLGLDLASTARAPVPAPNSGKVVYAGWMSLYGNAVVIDHGHGLLSLSGHLSAVSVAAGDRVVKGDTIGSSGATGLAGGDHLHLEIFVHGQSVDPLEWLDAKWLSDNLATKLRVPLG
jgi:murein DD-endopeptidase MepM/ murein hydrolase activator NlpD